MKNIVTILNALAMGILLAVSVPAQSTQTVFNVRDFGAVGDGKSLDSPSIDKAISAASAVGGGTVLVPAGTYLSGSIHLQSNIHLLIDAGATIIGAPQELNVYDETEPYSFGGYQDGGHCFFHNSLIWGENLTNVFITGNGMINGGGLVRSDDLLDRMCGFDHWQHPEPNRLPPVRLGNKAIALETLPQCSHPRCHHFSRRPFRDSRHRLRQP
jgi:polygalacturonase